MLAPVEQVVDRVVAVSACDDHRRRTELVQSNGELAARRVDARKCLRLHQVRRDDGRERKQTPYERVHGVVLEQLCARRRNQHRVDDQRRGMSSEEACDGLDHAPRAEHPGLRRVDSDVRVDRLELRDDKGCGHFVHGRHTGRVLRRQRDDRRHAVRACGGERLQVGLDAGAAAGVGGRDREDAWDGHGLPSPVLTGSGSTGVISATCAAPRCRQANTSQLSECASSVSPRSSPPPVWRSSGSSRRSPSRSSGRRAA